MRRPKSSSLLLAVLTFGGLVPVLVSGGCNGADNPNTGNKAKPGPTTNTWTLMAFNMGRNESDNYALSVANQLQGASAPASINFETAFSGINVNNPPFTTSRRITVKAGVASAVSRPARSNELEASVSAPRFRTGRPPWPLITRQCRADWPRRIPSVT